MAFAPIAQPVKRNNISDYLTPPFNPSAVPAVPKAKLPLSTQPTAQPITQATSTSQLEGFDDLVPQIEEPEEKIDRGKPGTWAGRILKTAGIKSEDGAANQGKGNVAINPNQQKNGFKKVLGGIDSELLRMLHDRKTLDKLKTESVTAYGDAPQMAVRTPQGDLLSKTQAQQNAANQINRRAQGSDAQLNAVGANMQNQAIAQQMQQAGMADAQMFKQSQQQADAAMSQNEQSRVAMNNANMQAYAAKMNSDIAAKNRQIQYKDKAVSDYWAKKNAEKAAEDKKQEMQKDLYRQKVGDLFQQQADEGRQEAIRTNAALMRNINNQFENEFNAKMEPFKGKPEYAHLFDPATGGLTDAGREFKARKLQDYQQKAAEYYGGVNTQLTNAAYGAGLGRVQYEQKHGVGAYDNMDLTTSKSPFASTSKLPQVGVYSGYDFTSDIPKVVTTQAKGGVVDAYFKARNKTIDDFNKNLAKFDDDFNKSRADFAKEQVKNFRRKKR